MKGASARHFAIALRLALGCLIGCFLLQLLLYLRPSPYGGPFLLEWRKYFALALYYDMLGVWLLALPFLLYWLIRWRRSAPRRAVAIHIALGALLAANLALSALDHELLRFLGVRLGLSFLVTYIRLETLSDSLFLDVLADDPGGPFLPVVMVLLAPALYLWWALRLISRSPDGARAMPGGLAIAIALAIIPFAAPANAWQMATGKFRLRKVEPVVIALAVDAADGFGDFGRPADLDRLALDYQDLWLGGSADQAWRFPDPGRPYLRVPVGLAAPPPADKWNIIYIQLETFRGVDMGFLRPPGAAAPSPTPYLDGLAKGGKTAVWTRALSFGQPSINGLFAVHCSVTPHSRRYITAFTSTAFDCLPDRLRSHGYRSEMFNAGDTDWDNSSYWLTRWYDRLRRFPEANGRDRPVFRAAAERIKALGASGRPFLASVVSVTNHTPFRSREPGFDIAGQATPNQRILNTMLYTDDVLREFLETLRGEPWFARTIVVITGDHGFNLGEHDGRPGQQNLHRESVWVPLLILGAHPRLKAGRHDRLSSLLDVAPTLADLIGLREANAWQGHSLLSPGASAFVSFKSRDMRLQETDAWSALDDPLGGQSRLYRQSDWLQRTDLGGERPELAGAMLDAASSRMRLNDYLLRNDRIWRRPPLANPAASGGHNAPRAAPPDASRRTFPPPSPAKHAP